MGEWHNIKEKQPKKGQTVLAKYESLQYEGQRLKAFKKYCSEIVFENRYLSPLKSYDANAINIIEWINLE